jgi:serine/threonine-protein kinase RsbW
MADQEGLEARTVDQLLDSTLDSVDIAEEAVLKEAQEIGFDEDDLHKIGMSVRECMVNAVVHGNRYNARKKVHVMIQRTPDRLAVVIQDEGEGFDMADAARSACEREFIAAFRARAAADPGLYG